MQLESEIAVLEILIFIVTANLFRLIRFNLVNQHVAEFTKTLKTSARPLSSFYVVLLIFFLAFLHLVF